MLISLPSLGDRLSADGRRPLFVDLDSDALKPEGWDTLEDDKSTLHSFSDISIYELHIRVLGKKCFFYACSISHMF